MTSVRFPASRLVMFGLLTSVAGGALQAQPSGESRRLAPEQAAAAFGALESVIDISLSPDGTKLAIVEPQGNRGMAVLVTDLTNPGKEPPSILSASGDPERINWCRWASSNRVLCNVYGSAKLDVAISYFNRIAALDADGKNMQVLQLPGRASMSYSYGTSGGEVIDWNPGENGHVLMERYYAPQRSVGTIMVRDLEGMAVDDIDSTNLRSRTVERPRTETWGYITDGVGNVRIMASEGAPMRDGYASSKTKYLYRLKSGGGWRDLSIFDELTNEGFQPHFVDPQRDVVYGLRKLDGRLAAYSIALDGTMTETLLLARPDVDIAGFSTIGRNNRVIGVTYSTDKTYTAYVDPQIEKLTAALARALPHLPQIDLIDASQDERKLLVLASSDTDPGRYFVLDRDSKAMIEVAMNRLALDKVTLATVKPVLVKARDGVSIPAYLTLPPGSDGKSLPAIVMPHGGPESRDHWGFDWLAQYWAQIGYAVLQPNFRGSTGYGDDWFQANGFQSWALAIGDVTDAGRWLIEQGIADPKRLAVFGWSYGGYAALQSAVVAPDLFRAVVAVAPVTDFGLFTEEAREFSSFRVERDRVGSGPHIEAGSPARHAPRIMAPVLMFHGTLDVNVGIRHSQLMADRLRDAGKVGRLVTYDKLDHNLEDSGARRDMLRQSAAFLDQAFGKN